MSDDTIVEGVARRVGNSLRRLAGGTPAPDLNTVPEQYPDVVLASSQVQAIGAALADAEATLRARESALAQAEVQAAEALIEGLDAPSLAGERQAVLHAAEQANLLALAEATAKARYAVALDAAHDHHWALLWRRFQEDVAAFDAALAVTYEAQHVVMASWNACGQPGDPPIFNGTMAVWESDFHRYLMELAATPAEHVHRGALPAIGQPSMY